MLRIGVVVGEPSGDRLGAQLAIALKQRTPSIEIEGVIGPEMIRAGCLQLCSMDTLGVMGIIDPIMSLPQILKMRRWLLRHFLENPPDLFIGIDAPDFNLNIEKILHNAGIPTVHFVSPSVWAWRQGRIKTIKKAVDLMLTLFPFEEKFYQQHGVPVCYTGHPTADLIATSIDKNIAKQNLGYAINNTLVAILPGSRNSEMKHMTPLYLNTIKIMRDKRQDLKFIMPLVQPAYKEYVEFWKQKIIPDLDLNYVIADSYAVMRAADVALVTSGTATLEMMLHKTPMIVAYKTDPFTYAVGKRLIKVKHIALPNLLADKTLVPEYIQHAATPEDLSSGLLELLNSEQKQQQQIHVFQDLHNVLKNNASEKAASAIYDLLDANKIHDY